MLYTAKALSAGRDLRNVVIQHSSFQKALLLVANALEVGNGAGIFSGVRIMAPSGSGKSLLIDCLQKNIINSPFLEGELSVIRTELKESPSVSQIQAGLLENFKYGLIDQGRRSQNNNEVHRVLLAAMREHRVQLIVLDEFQHVFSPSSDKVSTAVIDWLKRLMNLTQVPVVLVGTELMDRLGAVDQQFTTRIPTTVKLLPFQHNAEWIGFLKAMAQQCTAVDMALISQSPYATQLFGITQGVVRPLKTLLVQAVIMAVNAGEKHLSAERLYEAYAMVYGPEIASENPFSVY
ncbi:MAG: hypothetical protein CML16_17285 [Pusillimonas sp.]|nr:hypothetical protein [Pusillimonas sp.]MBC44117.1 hypothetical protein [Pusillimonas sp.]HCP77520.1 hypothetical protein [Pusillimonas sp.]